MDWIFLGPKHQLPITSNSNDLWKILKLRTHHWCSNLLEGKNGDGRQVSGNPTAIAGRQWQNLLGWLRPIFRSPKTLEEEERSEAQSAELVLVD